MILMRELISMLLMLILDEHGERKVPLRGLFLQFRLGGLGLLWLMMIPPLPLPLPLGGVCRNPHRNSSFCFVNALSLHFAVDIFMRASK